MKKINQKQKGIALITTIILTSIMLSSIVLITKEMADEVVNSTRLDNSMIAYYAAEAGLEDALLEFRYDHSAEISKENDTIPEPNNFNVLCVPPTNDCTYRTVNLSTSSTDYGARAYNTSYYDLVMWNKVKSVLDQKILKDNVAEFVIPNMTKNVTLNWAPNPNTPSNAGYRLEITVYDESGIIIPPFPTPVSDTDSRTGGKYFTNPTETTYIIRTTVGSGKRIIRIKPWYTKLSPESDGSYKECTVANGCSPISDTPYISLNINKTPTVDFIASTTTKIESIGYYGGVARKISATVDRPSGNILNIFDYAIYSGSDLIK